MTRKMRWWSIPGAVLVILGPGVSPAVMAQGLAVYLSPPRFELKAQPGAVLREVIEIGNAEDQVAEFEVRSADWTLDAGGGVQIRDARLDADSCRPWVRLERPTLRIVPKKLRRYRFEVHVPPEAKPGECRFAILIAPPAGQHNTISAGGVRLPVIGRLAVVVYVRVGDARPVLNAEGLRFSAYQGQQVPHLVLTNTGKAHGRPAGLLEARDAYGEKFNVSIPSLPVLPGERRALPLSLRNAAGDPVRTLHRPLHLTGVVEWEGGQARISERLD